MKIYPIKLRNILAFTGLLLALMQAVDVTAQAESPYSRFGLGTLRSPVFSSNQAMGFLAAPYASAININSANPASYASLTRTTLEIGTLIDGRAINTGDSVYKAGAGGVSHFAIAFVPNPKHNNWAITLGLSPYSNVDYNFIQNFDDSINGQYSQAYKGSGSLYQVFAGGAYKVNGFSIGANLGYLFGKLEYQKIIALPDSLYGLSTRNINNVNVNGFNYTVGVQYQKLLYHNHDEQDNRHDINMYIGAYGSGGIKLRTKSSNYWDRFYYDTYNALQVLDTLESTFNVKGKINLPFNIGAGMMFGNETFWLAGFDFKYANWSSYTTPLDNGGLNDSWQLSFGAQITPKLGDKGYLNNMQYRFGGYYGQSEILFNGHSFTQGGATIGFGLPFKNIAHLNLTGDFGSLSTPDRNIIRESYYRFTIGLVLNDIWFIKQKFD
ncbi:MAG TPA: hypothetical protein VG603_14000 [Chitinophagales bacterium]|nr:hypothetical protein [Chitinophagales bacterium]